MPGSSCNAWSPTAAGLVDAVLQIPAVLPISTGVLPCRRPKMRS